MRKQLHLKKKKKGNTTKSLFLKLHKVFVFLLNREAFTIRGAYEHQYWLPIAPGLKPIDYKAVSNMAEYMLVKLRPTMKHAFTLRALLTPVY